MMIKHPYFWKNFGPNRVKPPFETQWDIVLYGFVDQGKKDEKIYTHGRVQRVWEKNFYLSFEEYFF